MKRMLLTAILVAVIAPLAGAGQTIEVHSSTGGFNPGDSVDIILPLRSGLHRADVQWQTPDGPWQMIAQGVTTQSLPWRIPAGVSSFQLKADLQVTPASQLSFPLRSRLPTKIFGMPEEHSVITYRKSGTDHDVQVRDIGTGALTRRMRLPSTYSEYTDIVVDALGHAMLIVEDKRIRRIDLRLGLITEDTSKIGVVGYDPTLRTLAIQRVSGGVVIRRYNDSTGSPQTLGTIPAWFCTEITLNDTAVMYTADGWPCRYATLPDLKYGGEIAAKVQTSYDYGFDDLRVRIIVSERRIIVKHEPSGDTLVDMRLDLRFGLRIPEWAVRPFTKGHIIVMADSLYVVDYVQKRRVGIAVPPDATLHCYGKDTTFVVTTRTSIDRYRYRDGVIARTVRKLDDLEYPHRVRITGVGDAHYGVTDEQTYTPMLVDTNFLPVGWYQQAFTKFDDDACFVSPSGAYGMVLSQVANYVPGKGSSVSSHARVIDLSTGAFQPDVLIGSHPRELLWLQHPDRAVFFGFGSASIMNMRSGERSPTALPSGQLGEWQVDEVGIVIMRFDTTTILYHDGTLRRIPMSISTSAIVDTVFADSAADALFIVIRSSNPNAPVNVNGRGAAIHVLRYSIAHATLQQHMVGHDLDIRVREVIGYDRNNKRFIVLAVGAPSDTVAIHTISMQGRDARLLYPLPKGFYPSSSIWLPGPSTVVVKGSYDREPRSYVYDPLTAAWLDISQRDIIGYIDDGYLVLSRTTSEVQQERPRPAQGTIDVLDFRCKEVFSLPNPIRSLPQHLRVTDDGRSLLGVDSVITWYPWYGGGSLPAPTLTSRWYFTITTKDSTIDQRPEQPEHDQQCCPLYHIRCFDIRGTLVHEETSRSDRPHRQDQAETHHHAPGAVLYVSTCEHGARRGIDVVP